MISRAPADDVLDDADVMSESEEAAAKALLDLLRASDPTLDITPQELVKDLKRKNGLKERVKIDRQAIADTLAASAASQKKEKMYRGFAPYLRPLSFEQNGADHAAMRAAGVNIDDPRSMARWYLENHSATPLPAPYSLEYLRQMARSKMINVAGEGIMGSRGFMITSDGVYIDIHYDERRSIMLFGLKLES